MKRLAIVGASGFVGATLVERLLGSDDWELVPIIHSPGNAWRLSRHNMELHSVSLLDKDRLSQVLRGCTHVVNCSRGSNQVMFNGLNNLIKACRQEKVQRLVHLSSVMIYGDPPPPEAESETAPNPEMPQDSYGWVKQKQDKQILKACKNGLEATILVPPNISGPYSDYLQQLVQVIRKGELGLLDGGSAPNNLVDVNNLAHAIELALQADTPTGNRYFITDNEPVTWADLVRDLSEVAGRTEPLPEVSKEALARATAIPDVKLNPLRSLTHLVSSDIREALRKDPLLEKVDLAIRGGVARLGTGTEEFLRRNIEGTLSVEPLHLGPELHMRLSAQQLRQVIHKPDNAIRDLGYQPEYTYRESMQAFSRWYRGMHGLDTDYSQILKAMYN